MDFVKKHYEKILLAVVLLGLVGALVFLPFLIERDQRKVEEMSSFVRRPNNKPLAALDLTSQSNLMQRLRSPYVVDFATTNRLFNPLQWQLKPDGSIIPVRPGTVGPEAVVVTKIMPLYTILTLEAVDTNSLATNAQAARYVISVEHQAAAAPGQRGKRQHYASAGDKVDIFKILEIKGTLEDPSQLQMILQLTDTGERVTLTKGQPFRRADGYTADLKYDPENKKWQAQREGSVLKFNFDEYNIVAITPDTVILSARSNQKKTPRPYSPQGSE
ncbi:MAG TPA: hypothetical protein VMB80_10375 [Candidatus Acidoferrum sp.]|nr:hypothetical protein [Candidatus Acidoferrum sp.]